MLTAIVAWYGRHRFACLFVSLLLPLGAHPAIEAVVPGLNLLELLLAVSLLAAIAGAARDGAVRAMLALAVAFIAVRGVQAGLGLGALRPLSETLWVAGCLLAVVAAARRALRPGAVDGERIFAALDAYLLAGLVFGVAYWLLEQSWPGSFGVASARDLDLAGAVYFSFVTLATLGYGDIVPVSDTARGLAVLEAVGAQLYLAVLVARLVSLYARQADG